MRTTPPAEPPTTGKVSAGPVSTALELTEVVATWTDISVAISMARWGFRRPRRVIGYGTTCARLGCQWVADRRGQWGAARE